MKQLFKNNTGLTMLEVMMVVLLMSVVLLGVSSLYVASQKFYIGSSDKVIVGSEVQYAIQHINKYMMRGIGDKNTRPFQITGETQLDISISANDPLTIANYETNVTNYRYRYDAGTKKLWFKAGSGAEENLIPKVTVTDVKFETVNDNLLKGQITAYCNDSSKSLTFYFACYPRLASFN